MNNIEEIEFVPIASKVSDIVFTQIEPMNWQCFVSFYTKDDVYLGTKMCNVSDDVYTNNDAAQLQNIVFSRLGIIIQ